METRTGTARTLSSTCWALGCSALLGALACQSAAEPQVQSEPARTASSASAAAASSVAPSAAATAPSGTASSGAPATPPSAAPAAPIAQVGLAKYEEPSAAPAAPAAAATGRPSTAVQAADAPTADAPAAAAGQTVQGTVVNDESFSTWLQAVSPVSAGSPATVEAVLVAKSGYHCNAEYPHKFKLGAAPAGLSYPEATVKGMQVSPERSVLRIPVVAQSPGKATVSGTFQFSVCNDERCLIEKRDLSLALEVK